MIKDYFPPLSDNGRQWIKFLAVVAGGILLIWLAGQVAGVLTLVVISLALAYIFNPLINFAERRGLHRLLAITALYVVGFVIAGFGLVILGTLAEAQVNALLQALPDYYANVEAWLAERYPQLLPQVPAESTSEVSTPAEPPSLFAWTQDAWAATWEGALRVGGLFTGVSWVLTASVLIPMFTFFFLLRFDEMVRAVRDHLPAEYRPTIVHIVTMIDAKTADFFRGRLVTCFIVGALTGVGWLLVGVPYSLPFGAAVAILNLVPFLPIIVLPPVLLATYAHAGADWVSAVTLALAVFLVVQALESFVLYPVLSGKTAGLHPVTSLVALLIGAEVAGLLGMLLSIPVASTLKSLAGEYLIPEIKRLAAGTPRPASAPPPPEQTEP